MEDFLLGRKKRTVLRGNNSPYLEVTHGVSQGSVLAPIMFLNNLIYKNDIEENITDGTYMNMFADNAKVQRTNRDNVCSKML